MKREASIHIRETVLAQLLQEVIEDLQRWDFSKPYYTGREMARELLNKGKKHSCSSRIILVTNDKVMKKTDKLQLAGRNETGIFAQVLLLNRRKLHHKGLKMAEPGTQEWLDIKEACKLATEFCNEFGIGLKNGYNEYVRIGLSKIKNYSPYKFKSLHGAICKTYEASLELQMDKSPEETQTFFKEYLKLINEKVGYVSENFKNIPEKYVCFLYAKNDARDMGLDGATYMVAQFSGMEWANAIPDVSQIYGDKAKDRAIKYCYTNNIKLGKSVTRAIDFTKIKNENRNRSKK